MYSPLQHGSGFEELLELIVPVTALESEEIKWVVDELPCEGRDDWRWLRGQVRALRARLVERRDVDIVVWRCLAEANSAAFQALRQK